MKKVLFLDRDGTIIVEPPVTFQIDSLEKLEFLPYAISSLRKIVEELDFELMMVSNQDGLGTKKYPKKSYDIVQKKLLKTLSNEGIEFNEILIDKSFDHENSPNRKPRTGMLKKYLNGNYDLKNSFVIGDRITDLQLAKNLGTKAILVRNDLNKRMKVSSEFNSVLALDAKNWNEIYSFFQSPSRKISHTRKTNETDIIVELDLDGKRKSKISTDRK